MNDAKKQILTSIWSVQHPNAGQNKQQINSPKIKIKEWTTLVEGLLQCVGQPVSLPQNRLSFFVLPRRIKKIIVSELD